MMTLTRYGLREWGGGGIVALLLAAGFILLILAGFPVTGGIGTGLVVLCWLGLAAFFRNPVRHPPMDPALLVSPADGVVRDIGEVDFDQPPFDGKAQRIGIFLSVLNVHVNRAPADLEVQSVVYREGRYLDARSAGCATENEAMTIAGIASAAGHTFPMGIRQISGAIARRIVCPVQPERRLRRGEIYGMIKFGSRTELYLPLEGVEIRVRPGDRVYGGKTVIAAIRP